MNALFRMITQLLLLSVLPAQSTLLHEQITVGFSAQQQAHNIVIHAIRQAKKSIHIAAFVLSEKQIIEALIAASHKGVAVHIIIDHQQSCVDRKPLTRQNHLRRLATITSLSAIYPPKRLHSKYMLIDQLHVQTGSFNYSAAAAYHNQENVIYLQHVPQLATRYFANWQALYRLSEPLKEGC